MTYICQYLSAYMCPNLWRYDVYYPLFVQILRIYIHICADLTYIFRYLCRYGLYIPVFVQIWRIYSDNCANMVYIFRNMCRYIDAILVSLSFYNKSVSFFCLFVNKLVFNMRFTKNFPKIKLNRASISLFILSIITGISKI